MHQALPIRHRVQTVADGGSAAPPPGNASPTGSTSVSDLRRVVSENSVVAFARRGCCMCHVVKLLLNGHGVNPFIFDVDEKDEADLTTKLTQIAGKSDMPPDLPAVFVGREMIGGLENIMAAHISGELVPRLKKARALWL